MDPWGTPCFIIPQPEENFRVEGKFSSLTVYQLTCYENRSNPPTTKAELSSRYIRPPRAT
jgi:hypothetical protein